MANTPRGRETNNLGQGKDIYRRGDGLNTGSPAGGSNGYQNRPQGQSYDNGGQRTTRAGGKGGLISIIAIIAALVLGGGGFGITSLLGGGDDAAFSPVSQAGSALSGYIQSAGSSYSGYTDSSVSSAGTSASAATTADTAVASGSRAKYTQLLGDGKDTVTIMLYLCGTDLESKSGMATSDLQEIANATVGSNVNIIAYTGGCKKWQNNVISSSVNQIYKVETGGLRALSKDEGTAAMTKPSTLSGFIQYCAKDFPANRNILIFWDHGGGSLSGYGYDEKNSSAGSMTLKGINEALKNGNTKFDFIGFDACLMGTLENGLMLAPYADYLIASEETEPGIGWYYTNWVTALSKNTSMPTVELGKQIVDDFVTTCARQCRGQKATLSVVDLAELENTVPDKLKDFAVSTSELINGDDFKTVSRARSSTREFASSNKLDQVDLVHLCNNLGTTESKALAKALENAVKYNRTSSDMTNANGISIYFPYQKTSKVSSAVATYEAIGLDSEYSKCIQQFASMEVGGQAMSGGSASPLSTLLSGMADSQGSSSGMDILSGLLSGNLFDVSGLTSGNSSFFGRGLDLEQAAAYLDDNRLDPARLTWQRVGGVPQILLTEEEWSLVNDLELNVFYDDGEGYIDLGLDNRFTVSASGALSGTFDGTWISIDRQPVAYYHLDTVENGSSYTITGRVPVLLNGERADLLLVFTDAQPYGTIAGATYEYAEGTTETVAKSLTELTEGDLIDFICDYYDYDGNFLDSYMLGDRWTYHADPEIGNVTINADRAQATYRFTDIYNQQYWTPAMQ